jgi:hypothetical protein
VGKPGEDAVNKALIDALNDVGADADQIEKFMAMTPMLTKFGEFVAQQFAAMFDTVGEHVSERAQDTRDPYWVGMGSGLAIAKESLSDGPEWAKHLTRCTCLDKFRTDALNEFGVETHHPEAPWQQRGAMDIYNMLGRLVTHLTPEDTDDPWRVGVIAGIAACRTAIMSGDEFVNRVGLRTENFLAKARSESLATFGIKE